MSALSEKQMECYLSMMKSHAGMHFLDTIKANLGKHFLSQMKKLNHGSVFTKLKDIESKKGEQEDEQTIKKEAEFYKSKMMNLIQKLRENKEKLWVSEEYRRRSEMEAMEMMYEIESLRWRAEEMEKYSWQIDWEIQDLKDYYES